MEDEIDWNALAAEIHESQVETARLERRGRRKRWIAIYDNGLCTRDELLDRLEEI